MRGRPIARKAQCSQRYFFYDKEIMNFFVCKVRKNKHSWIPSVLSSLHSNLQTHHRLLSSPSTAFLIQTSFLFGVLFLASIWFSPFLYGLLSLFAFRPLTFSIFGCFCRTICMSRSFFICTLSISVYKLLSSLFLFISLPPGSYFFISGPLFPLLDSPVPISVPFDQTSSPSPCLRQLKKHSRLEWNRKNTVEREDERWQPEPGKGVSGP